MNLLQRPFWIDVIWLILLFGTLALRFHFKRKPLFCYEVFRRLIWTFLAAFAGAFSAFFLIICYFGASPDVGPTIAYVVLMYTAYAWVFFILPLTLWFSDDSKIYLFRFSIPLDIAFSLIALALATTIDIPSVLQHLWPLSIIVICPVLFGITVSVTLSILAGIVTRSQTSAEQGAAANP